MTLKVLELFADLEIKVSDCGDIYSLDKKCVRKNGRLDNRKGKKIKPAIDKDGYLRVTLSRGGERHSYYVHRLVVKAFIPNPENKPTVNHINGIKNDNRVENLEWATHKEQKRHSIEHHLCDMNIIALKNANECSSRKVLWKNVLYPSIKAASRVSHDSQWAISKGGKFYE